MDSFAIWFYASRPKTLFIGASPICLAAALSYRYHQFNLLYFFLCLIGAFLIQIGTNYSNDYYDFLRGADQLSTKGSPKILQLKVVSLTQMKRAFIFCFVLAGLLSVYLAIHHGIFVFYVGVLSIFFSLLYTAGPYPLAYLGIADIFVAVFYGPVAFLTAYYIQTSHITYEAFFLSWLPGLCGIGPLLLNNIRDEIGDRNVGKKTIVVRLGRRFGCYYYFFLHVAITFLITYISIYFSYPWMLLGSIGMFFSVSTTKSLFKSSDHDHFLFIKNAKTVPVILLLIGVSVLFKRWLN